MSKDIGGPLVVLALAFVLLVFTVGAGLWLDGRPARKEAKREATRRRRERT